MYTEEKMAGQTIGKVCPAITIKKKEGNVVEETNKMALASMIAGILSIVLSCCCGLGIVAGSLAVISAGLSRVEEPLSTNAKAGLITGIIGIILSMIAVVILTFLMAGVMGNGLETLMKLGRALQ